jgi:trk system potassium uptake protein TrkH
MINKRIFNMIGYVLVFLGISMLFSAIWSYLDNSNDLIPILKSSFITSSFGFCLIFLTQLKFFRFFPYFSITDKNKLDLSHRDGYTLVSLSWIMMAIFSALPFYLYGGVFDSYIDSFFESISGLTTTGASILSLEDYSNIPRGIMFWRSFTHFIGGIGIIVFSIAILPLMGFGGVQLFRAEVAGPVADKLTPRIRQTATLLWSIYFGLIVSETVILVIEGLTFYDALTHAFATMATGGFSTNPDSIASYPSIVQYTIILFMILAASSFSLHFLAFRKGRIEYFKDQEFKVYLSIIILFSLVFFTDNYIINFFKNGYFEEGFRNSLFTSVSLLTTTGFSTIDYQGWNYTSQTMVFVLLFIGGCAGSTTGGIKIIRTILVFKFLSRELKKLIHPKGVFKIKIGSKKVSEEIVNNTVGFYLFYIFIFVFASIIFACLGLNFNTSLSVAASSIGNIGPGLGDIGPSSNWANIGAPAKMLASFLMLLGRLEIFTVMLLFSGGFSKK